MYSLDDIMETIFHEIAHLDPKLDAQWKQSTPGIGTLSEYPNQALQAEVHGEIETSVGRLMEIYRAQYRP